jgi:carbon storage regulator
MLCLSRKESESLVLPGRGIAAVKDWLDDQIEIVVIAIEGDRVKLGIDCPDEVDVYRHEVWRSVKRKEKEETRDGNLDS